MYILDPVHAPKMYNLYTIDVKLRRTACKQLHLALEARPANTWHVQFKPGESTFCYPNRHAPDLNSSSWSVCLSSESEENDSSSRFIRWNRFRSAIVTNSTPSTNGPALHVLNISNQDAATWKSPLFNTEEFCRATRHRQWTSKRQGFQTRRTNRRRPLFKN